MNHEAHKIQFYADGELKKETATNTNEGVAHSDYNLTIGACPSQEDLQLLTLHLFMFTTERFQQRK